MKNLGLIMLLLLSLGSCKTRKSHVVKSYLDSSYVNREINDIEIGALKTRELNSSVKLDSSWKDVIRLKGFTGTISPSGEIKGEAEEAEIDRSGNMNRNEDKAMSEKDSLNVTELSQKKQEGKIIRKDLEKSKGSKGFYLPWYLWIFLAIGLLLIVYNVIKKYLKPF